MTPSPSFIRLTRDPRLPVPDRFTPLPDQPGVLKIKSPALEKLLRKENV